MSDSTKETIIEDSKNDYLGKKNDNLKLKEDLPKVAEELYFIKQFTFMTKEDILNSLERIKELKNR